MAEDRNEKKERSVPRNLKRQAIKKNEIGWTEK